MSMRQAIRVYTRTIPIVAALLAMQCAARTSFAKDAQFYRAFNLNGPAVKIDGHDWEAGDAGGLRCDDSAFENQSVRLVPGTDEARGRMIRSSRWSPSGKARLRVTDVAKGAYSVYLYVWEDNDPQTFDIRLADKVVAKGVNSGNAGHWQRLGPWAVDVKDGSIELRADGGHANLSGLEIWRGKLTGQEHPLEGTTPAKSESSVDAQVALLLARNCLECHNASDHKGGLNLTSRQSALAGGDSGAVLEPGSATDSELLARVAEREMPPKDRPKLLADEVALLRKWIDDGAKWAADPIDPFLYTSDRRAGYNWWSLQPLKTIEPPTVDDSDWPRGAIDQFILKRLQDAGLKPSGEADRRVLIRRLSYDLIGLPPTPEEIEAFVHDPDPQAYDNLVDRLLASPHYGERWARHWLDVVRYGESQGFERNKFRPSVWKYRDWVVEAFNSDLPYDQFVRWQLAGDVLEPDDPLALIASGLLALGPYDLTAYNNGTADMRALAREEELEGLVGTVSQAFLGLTINCARCHDHKFDPIRQEEFYQISAAVGGTYQGEERESVRPQAKEAVQRRIEAIGAKIEGLSVDEKSATPQQQRQCDALRSRYESVIRLLKGGPVHTTVPKQPPPWRVLARGDYRQPGEIVVPRGVAAVRGVSPNWHLNADSPEKDRRKALAAWIADSENPLTPRVIVNRLWGYHFGAGLVRTPSDFGFQGGQPSHLELLDWLAGQLVHPPDGRPWSLKRIHRLIVTSATYRQSSQANEAALKIDADNRLHWRHEPQRLEAEAFRDAVLAVSGQLDPRLGGPGFRDWKETSAGDNETYTVFDAVGGEFNRRSIYRSSVRSGTSRLLDTLDCPDPSVATPQRSVTSTPLQALTLLNNKFMEYYSSRFAERLKQDAKDDGAAQVRRGYALAFGRPPDDEELAFGQKFVAERGLDQFCLVLLNANEFLYVD